MLRKVRHSLSQKRLQASRHTGCVVSGFPHAHWRDPSTCQFVSGTHNVSQPYKTGDLAVGSKCDIACDFCGPKPGGQNPYCDEPYNSKLPVGDADIGQYWLGSGEGDRKTATCTAAGPKATLQVAGGGNAAQT